MTNSGFMKFKEWKREFLKARGLERPDGRSLYEYRVSRDEFEELEALLRTWLGLLIGRVQLGQVLRLADFPALFVLYASERWRRRYDGTGYSWGPILEDLGVAPDSWTPGERSQCVKEGLAAWGLKPREHGALRFLGEVAVQGGLPLRLLGEARGGIGRLLARVLQLAKGGDVGRPELKGWIESLQNWLPKSYRKDIIYELLTEVILVALRLKQEAELSAGDDAVAVLDERVPAWKDRFPVSMEDRYARMLVEQLVRDVANIRVRRVKPCLPVERHLEHDEEGVWSLVSRVELPEALDHPAVTSLFGMRDESNLPRTAKLSLLAGKERVSTTLRDLAGRNAYRVEPTEFSFSGDAASQEHLFELSAPDGRAWLSVGTKGVSLDEQLPWVFSVGPPQELVKQGAGRVANSEVFLAMPDDWQCQADGESNCQAVGSVQPWNKSLFRLGGTATLKAADNTVSALRTGQADASEAHYTWVGTRFWLDFMQPCCAYKGIPTIYRVDDEGGRHRVHGRPAWRVIGNGQANDPLGPVLLQYPATGVPQIRTRMLLLPEQSSLDYSDVHAHGGTIRFSHWGLSKVEVIEPPISHENFVREGDDALLEVSVADGVRAPEWITLELLWSHTTKSVRLKLPYPANGVRAFDARGNELKDRQRIAADDLAGFRLVINRGGLASEKLTLVISVGHSHLARRYPLSMCPGVLSTDIALIDYETDIQQLLSLDDSPDSKVSVSIVGNGNQSVFSLELARYAAVIEQDGLEVALDVRDQAQLELKQFNSVQLLATRLEHPEDDPVELTPRFSEGVHTGRWKFDPESREPGSWLVYPPEDSALQLRPMIWPVGAAEEIGLVYNDELIQAIANPNQRGREEAIGSVIESMASDFQHTSWKTVEQLARQFGHLPLATLDLWRVFAHSGKGMAALAFRFSDLPRNFYLRFARELPLAWETVAVSAWKQAMSQLSEQCRKCYAHAADLIFKEHLSNRLTTLCGALSYLLGIAAATVDEEERSQLDLLREFSAHTAGQRLFEGDDSKLMRLLRAHAEDEWPTGFNDILDSARSDPEIGRFLYTDQNEYRNGVINLPIIASLVALLDRSEKFFTSADSIHRLRTAKAFDLEWFDDAYNLTVARYLIEGTHDV